MSFSWSDKPATKARTTIKSSFLSSWQSSPCTSSQTQHHLRQGHEQRNLRVVRLVRYRQEQNHQQRWLLGGLQTPLNQSFGGGYLKADRVNRKGVVQFKGVQEVSVREMNDFKCNVKFYQLVMRRIWDKTSTTTSYFFSGYFLLDFRNSFIFRMVSSWFFIFFSVSLSI